MDFILSILDACGTVKKEKSPDELKASEMQLNCFEFRNYKTRLDSNYQRVIERIVNQWCSMLVRGKIMKINGFEEEVWIDKDMINIIYDEDTMPLRAIKKIELFRDADEMAADAPYGLDVSFEGIVSDTNLTFSFEHERHRLAFAITLRILRARDPLLDPTQTMEVIGRDPEDDDERKTFKRLATMPRYKAERGIPVVISISDLKIYHQFTSTSRHVYLELFVRYPAQDQFLYAKSPTTSVPQQILVSDDPAALKRRVKEDENEEDTNFKKEEAKKILGADVPISAMRFALKNVKLRIPRTPHKIFGRIMARDDYFPTAVATFEFEILQSHLQDRRNIDPQEKRRERNGKDDGSRTAPETLSVPVYAPQVDVGADTKDKTFHKMGLLTLRTLGYILDDREYRDYGWKSGKSEDEHESNRRSSEGVGSKECVEEEAEEEIQEEDEEEDVDEGPGEEAE